MITLYVARPLRWLGSAHRGVRIPILLYHSISEASGSRAHPYFVTETHPSTFANQMKYMHDHGYSTITLSEVLSLLNSRLLDRKKRVVITFDNGYRDFYKHAFPILNGYGFRAHVFLPTAYIGQQRLSLRGRDCLTWSEVRELHEAGVIFGSHTVTRSQLHSFPIIDIEREIQESKDSIENELGAGISSFSYPYAFPEEDREFMHRLRDILQSHGYQNGVTTILGSVQTHEDRFFLRRLPTNSYDDLALLQAKLNGDYDWLRSPQYLKKLIERQMRRHEPRGTPTDSAIASPN